MYPYQLSDLLPVNTKTTFVIVSSTFFSDFFLPGALALVMLGMGLTLTIEDFKGVFKHPRGIFIGLGAQMLLLPLIAFLIAALFPIAPEVKVGLVLLAACPGGSSSNLVNHLLKGNVALSISLTAFNSLLALFTIPIVVNLAMNIFLGKSHEFHLPMGHTMLNIFCFTILPALVGVYLRGKFPITAKIVERPLRYILPVVLFIAFGGIFFFDRKDNSTHFTDLVGLLPIALLLNIAGMVAGYYLSLMGKQGKKIRTTVAVEVGLQNSSLAIFIATTLLKSTSMAVVAVLYGITSFFITVLIGWLIYRFVEE